MHTIGERIRAFATYKYFKINDFADALSMSAPNVQAYMRGARKPGTAVLQKIQKLGCNLDWLLTGEGEMYIEKEDLLKEDSRSVKPLVNTDCQFNCMNTKKQYFFEAMGRRLAIHDEDILDGDILIIEPMLEPVEGDLILRSSPEGPEFVRFQQGEKNTKGVIVALTRQYPAIHRKSPKQ